MDFEGRRQKRVALKQVVTVDKNIKAVGLDLSTGGMYVHTGRHFPVGSTVSLALNLYGQAIDVRARVQHAQESIGMGLEFLDLTFWQKAAIERFVYSSADSPAAARSARPPSSRRCRFHARTGSCSLSA